MATKRKTTTGIVAGVTAAALLLGGTFAWTSISQQAKNEAIVDINPGGRLHDDFNGTNKDVYVENFGDDTTGVPIYARIRLDQYFEVGQDAGINKDGTGRKVNKLLGTDINDVTTWVTYIPGDLSDTSKVQANTNWQWALGNDNTNLPIYLPTFNMNKDSLAADVNGTYEGTVEDDIVHYDDYKTYTDGQTVEGTEVHDWDSNAKEEAEGTTEGGVPAYSTTDPNAPIDDAHVYLKSTDEDGNNLTHTAKPISSTATVMTMAEWIAAGSQPGAYWVYDTDGWAYWAQPIAPGETTGLLLDSINMSKVPDDNYYYGINVVAQFATKGDISEFNAGEPDSDQTWTSEAEELFVTITGEEQLVITGADMIVPGETANYSATRMVLGNTAANQPASITWTATDADGNEITGVTMDETTGKLTVAETVPLDTKITVTATAGDGTATADGETTALTASKTVTVKSVAEAYTVDETMMVGAYNTSTATDFVMVVKMAEDKFPGYFDPDTIKAYVKYTNGTTKEVTIEEAGINVSSYYLDYKSRDVTQAMVNVIYDYCAPVGSTYELIATYQDENGTVYGNSAVIYTVEEQKWTDDLAAHQKAPEVINANRVNGGTLNEKIYIKAQDVKPFNPSLAEPIEKVTMLDLEILYNVVTDDESGAITSVGNCPDYEISLVRVKDNGDGTKTETPVDLIVKPVIMTTSTTNTWDYMVTVDESVNVNEGVYVAGYHAAYTILADDAGSTLVLTVSYTDENGTVQYNEYTLEVSPNFAMDM